jgi:hypothetical protein
MLSVQVETMRYAAFDAALIELSWGVASDISPELRRVAAGSPAAS